MAMNYVTFNQDYSRIGVATTAGFRIMYTDPFSKCYETHQGNITRLDMLYSTALVALVLSPRRLVITNTKRNSTICEMTFPSTILAVRMNRKRFVVVTEDQIYVYDISNMKSVHTIDTSPNPQASDRCYLAYPLPQRAVAAPFTPPSHVPPTSPHTTLISGHVMIFDAISKQAVNVIEAHRAPLSCIAMNADGTQLATASDKGTIIRVFSVPDARKLFQFRRGSMPARILSMSFNATSTLLCVSSETETVHVFRLSSAPAGTDSPAAAGRQRRQSEGGLSSASDELNDALGARSAADSDIATRKHDGTLAGMIRRTSQTVGKGFVASMSGYLPSAVSEMLEPARDFAWFKIPKLAGATPGAVRSVVAMSSNSPQVMVVTSDGAFLVFTIDLEKGGEGALVRQYSCVGTSAETLVWDDC